MDWGIFKRHPYLSAGGAILVFVFVYLARSRSAGADSGTSSSSGTSASDVQMAQLQAAQAVAQLQTNAQVQVAGLQAGVQTASIAAQQEATDTQTAAQLQAILAQTKAQTDISAISTTGQTEQARTYAGIIESQYQSQVQIHQGTVDYLTNLTNNQADVAMATLDAAKAIELQKQQYQQQNNQAVLNNITNVGGSQNRTALLLSVQGNYGAANTAVAGQTISSISGDNLLAQIGKASAGALATLLG